MTPFRETNGKWVAPHRLVDSWPTQAPTDKPVTTALANLLPLENILLDLHVSSKAQLFEEIGRHMERMQAMPHAWVAESLTRRLYVFFTPSPGYFSES